MLLSISDQLSRLHMILKPFMLRRVKKDVENELSDKVYTLSLLCHLKRQHIGITLVVRGVRISLSGA